MAAPNIVGLTTIIGITTSISLSTSGQTILSNPSSSGKVLKINTITASNISASSANVTVRYVQGAAGVGVTVSIANGISVTSGSTLVILDKASSIYLEEARSIIALSSANTALDIIISYEDIT